MPHSCSIREWIWVPGQHAPPGRVPQRWLGRTAWWRRVALCADRDVPVHDRDKALTHAALVIAGGGACLDIEHLRARPDLLGPVPSDAIVSRTFAAVTADDRLGKGDAINVLRDTVLREAKPLSTA